MMRKDLGLYIILGAVLGPVQQGWADSRDKALAVIDRAIQVQGGEERLSKTRIFSRKAKGSQFLAGTETKFTTDLVMDLPDRFHDTIEADIAGQKKRLVQIVNGGQGWHSAAGAVADIDKDELATLREEAYVIWLTTLVPLKDKAFALTLLPEGKVDGRSAMVVKVSRKGHADTRLYFDRRTHLLVQIQRRARIAGLDVAKEYRYSAYKEFAGVKLATKQIEKMNGNKTGELVISTFKFLDKVDDKLFTRP